MYKSREDRDPTYKSPKPPTKTAKGKTDKADPKKKGK